MSKAVLVIDMPTKCKECPCAYEWANRCNRTKKAVIDFDKVQDWCPLRPLNNKTLEGLKDGNMETD